MNNYYQTTSELFDLQKFAIKLGLENITSLSSFLNNPHLRYQSIHIAGTNGKGSTAFYISKILQSCGLKVGLFTSPHLVDFRERIRINDEIINKEYVIDFWNDIKVKVLDLKATFFDTTTLMAFKYFADNKIDIAVFETGLGGRLDSTNILKSEYAVLSPISFDHQKQLGNNITSIASEKAGIIKNGSFIFSARQNPKALKVLEACSKGNFLLYFPDHFDIKIKTRNLDGINFSLKNKQTNETNIFYLPTIAPYQADNFSMAFIVVKEYCKNNNINLSPKKIKHAMSSVSWPGRLQLIQKHPHIFFDVSHNMSGIKKTINALTEIISGQRIHLLLGIVNDKDAASIVKFLSGKFKSIIVTEPDTPRKKDGEVLKKMFIKQKQNVEFIKDLPTAFEFSKKSLKKNDTLIALGSHYLIGALMRIG
jgi:dihydrofolate synthase/folylpolyglutamate synthase